MDTLNRREEGYEREFSHQEELCFKARARRNRKLGAWAGEKLGLTGQALQDYATGLVDRGLTVADDEALAAELAEALKPSDVSLHRVRRHMATFDAEAMAGLAGRTARLLTDRGAGPVPPVHPADLDLRTDWLGTTYGDPTPASRAAVETAAAAGLTLEPVYTGKALAAVHDLQDSLEGPVLWVQTHGPR